MYSQFLVKNSVYGFKINRGHKRVMFFICHRTCLDCFCKMINSENFTKNKCAIKSLICVFEGTPLYTKALSTKGRIDIASGNGKVKDKQVR